MDRRIETRTWTRKRLSILFAFIVLVAGGIGIVIFLSTPRMRVERDKLTLSRVRRGTFQEYILPRGEVLTGSAGPEVRAAVDRYEAPRLAVGQKGETEIAGRRHALEITGIGPAGEHGVEVRLRFADEIPATPPGQELHVRLNLGEPAEALLLARGAFFQASGGHWAWIVDETGGRAVKREIRLGRQNPEVHEVLSGLTPGDRVITSTYDHLEGAEELVLTP